ncbi:MAG: FecCD family ABC transporter permease [Bilophila wadsworthia]
MHAIPAARYLTRRKRQNLLLGLLALVALCMLLLGVSVGNGVVRLPLGLSEHELALFVRLRLPRVLMGALVGAGLAMSGTLAQAVLRNPLASPFTLGISSGAAFGAALAILLGGASQWGMAGNAFVFAIDGVCALGFARLRDSRPETLILGGVAIMFLFSAATSLLQYVATEYQVQAIVFGGSAIWDAWDGRSWGWPLS